MARILLLLLCLLLTARPIAAASLSALVPDGESAYSTCLMAAAAEHGASPDAAGPTDHPHAGSIHHQHPDCACSMIAIPPVLWHPTDNVSLALNAPAKAPLFHSDAPPHGPPRRSA